jgi:hypothetical protein
MNYILTAIVLCAFLLTGSSDGQINPNPSPSEFAIYCLKDSLITTEQAEKLPLDSLVLTSDPLLSEHDITSYHWSRHIIDVQPRIDSILNAMGKWLYKSAGVPFVVTVGSQRMYLGTFWWSYSSSLPPVAYIVVPTSHPKLSYNSFCQQPDKRSDMRIHDALVRENKLVE